MFHAEEGGEFGFKGLTLGAQGEPKVERTRHSCFDLILGEHTACVRNAILPGNKGSALRIGAGAVFGVGESGELAGKAQDFGFDFGRGH